MQNSLIVKIWDQVIGYLVYNEKVDIVYFKYDEEFKKGDLDISPLLMSIKDNREFFSFETLNQETFRKLPPVFSDSLPDKFGNSVINSYLQINGLTIDDLNPLEILTYIGKRGMGALEYEPSKSFIKSDSKDNIRISEIVSIAQEILEKRENQKLPLNSLYNIIKVSSTPGGARAKAIISINHKTNEVLPGDILFKDQNVRYYLLKIDSMKNAEDKTYGKIEYAYYLMATKSGINMTESKLYEEENRFHFFTERFDRVNQEKVHKQTLNSLANMDYNNPLLSSYEQVFHVMNKLDLSHEEKEQQFRRMVFNVMAMNRDDHTKNISFLMDKTGKWTLSPAYDITYSYDPTNRWTKQHQLSINGKRKDIFYEDLKTIAEKYKIGNYKEIIEEVKEGVSQWHKIAKEVGISKEIIQLIDKNLEYDNLNNTRNFKLRR